MTGPSPLLTLLAWAARLLLLLLLLLPPPATGKAVVRASTPSAAHRVRRASGLPSEAEMLPGPGPEPPGAEPLARAVGRLLEAGRLREWEQRREQEEREQRREREARYLSGLLRLWSELAPGPPEPDYEDGGPGTLLLGRYRTDGGPAGAGAEEPALDDDLDPELLRYLVGRILAGLSEPPAPHAAQPRDPRPRRLRRDLEPDRPEALLRVKRLDGGQEPGGARPGGFVRARPARGLPYRPH
ncbi:proSAAS [Tachyglossus aculeatus]|uniref:proSAAS n=1 Tax=Tachyglossus aculeatus TaxID=9261 RepID=UPI0018F39785|nr:proSAAS [Tachyglossus aculeatus]